MDHYHHQLVRRMVSVVGLWTRPLEPLLKCNGKPTIPCRTELNQVKLCCRGASGKEAVVCVCVSESLCAGLWLNQWFSEFESMLVSQSCHWVCQCVWVCVSVCLCVYVSDSVSLWVLFLSVCGLSLCVSMSWRVNRCTLSVGLLVHHQQYLSQVMTNLLSWLVLKFRSFTLGAKDDPVQTETGCSAGTGEVGLVSYKMCWSEPACWPCFLFCCSLWSGVCHHWTQWR